MFFVGQKVVCINNEIGPELVKWSLVTRTTLVRRGQVLTIREIDTRAIHLHGCAALRFNGIVGTIENTTVGPWEQGASFPATHFRPVVERKTDISIFQRMLTDTREPA